MEEYKCKGKDMQEGDNYKTPYIVELEIKLVLHCDFDPSLMIHSSIVLL